jgi:hypothetical protein
MYAAPKTRLLWELKFSAILDDRPGKSEPSTVRDLAYSRMATGLRRWVGHCAPAAVSTHRMNLSSFPLPERRIEADESIWTMLP